MKKSKLTSLQIILSLLLVASIARTTAGWSNGGYSSNSSQPLYGTHDWIAEHALDWLPTQEKKYIQDNVQAYLYGTELPDNNNASVLGHIGDTTRHHVYFWSSGAIQEDNSAIRASQEYEQALVYLNASDYVNAAKTAGIMSHYIADVAVFAHVMGSTTDWGAETGNVHSNYESYVNTRTSSYSTTYNNYLSYDGNLVSVSAYDATLNIARDTTFDKGGIYNCTWMDNHYSTSNPIYWNRAGESLNLAVNTLADVLHTLYVNSNQLTAPTPSVAPNSTPTPTSSPAISPSTLPPTITPTPKPSPTQTTTLKPTTSPTVQPTSYPTAKPTSITSQKTNPTPATSVPEISPLTTFLAIIFVSTIITVLRKRDNNHAK